MQTNNISDVARGSDEITHSIVDVADAANNASAHAGSVQEAAQELAALAEHSGHVVEQFKI